MNLLRCENGHYYDTDRFSECPFCNQTTVNTVNQDAINDDARYTMPIDPQADDLGSIIEKAKGTDEMQKTVGYFGDLETEPVVGWLVAISGPHFGQDFKLKTGRNFIGRSLEMDVSLTEDDSISREKHAIILYEPRSNNFLVQPGDAKELFYLNDKVVLQSEKIEANNILSLGKTNLLFIPCCSNNFNWDDIKLKEETK